MSQVRLNETRKRQYGSEKLSLKAKQNKQKKELNFAYQA